MSRIVRRYPDGHLVANDNADPIPFHFTAQLGRDLQPVFEGHFVDPPSRDVVDLTFKLD